MTADPTSPVNYRLPVGDDQLDLRSRLGQTLTMHFGGEIRCANCDRVTKKSFNQGFCFPCARRLAACDICILRPERCHYDQGTCREPEWGDANCMQSHFVYLANTSGLKVGITRHNQVPTRWIDQGATAALPILRVATRQVSGLAEVAIAKHVSDKTDWRAMLKGSPEPIDLHAARDRLLQECEPQLAGLRERFGDDALEMLPGEETRHFEYPVMDYPEKVRSLNFDKTEEIGGTLVGIKGQYLIFDHAVINVRRFTSYVIRVVD
jgi:hypothetical protein